MRPTRPDRKAARSASPSSDRSSAAASGDGTVDSPYKPASAPERNILATAASGPFKTLARAIRSAGLGELLSEQGPYTVFAPTDKAFSRMPKPELDALMSDRGALTELLRFHVVRNKVKRAVREAFWELGDQIPDGHDYVVVARPGVEGLLEREGQEGIRSSLAELVTESGEERLS